MQKSRSLELIFPFRPFFIFDKRLSLLTPLVIRLEITEIYVTKSFFSFPSVRLSSGSHRKLVARVSQLCSRFTWEAARLHVAYQELQFLQGRKKDGERLTTIFVSTVWEIKGICAKLKTLLSLITSEDDGATEDVELEEKDELKGIFFVWLRLIFMKFHETLALMY